MKKRTHGFTLVELMITVAVIAIVAALAIPNMLAAGRNASVSSVSFDLLLNLQGLKTRALADQRTFLAVLVDAPGNNGAGCNFGRIGGCAYFFVLRDPPTTWKLKEFDPVDPTGGGGQLVESGDLGRGIRFASRGGVVVPPPFATLKSLAAVPTCKDGRSCFAVRFEPDGNVMVEAPDGTDRTLRAVVLTLGSEMEALSGGAESRALVVASPSGIIRAVSYLARSP